MERLERNHPAGLGTSASRYPAVRFPHRHDAAWPCHGPAHTGLLAIQGAPRMDQRETGTLFCQLRLERIFDIRGSAVSWHSRGGAHAWAPLAGDGLTRLRLA